jgi:hypothetical protein
MELFVTGGGDFVSHARFLREQVYEKFFFSKLVTRHWFLVTLVLKMRATLPRRNKKVFLFAPLCHYVK